MEYITDELLKKIQRWKPFDYSPTNMPPLDTNIWVYIEGFYDRPYIEKGQLCKGGDFSGSLVLIGEHDWLPIKYVKKWCLA